MTSPRNRTLTLDAAHIARRTPRLLRVEAPADLAAVDDRVIHGDALDVLDFLPAGSIDLVCADPPYNLNKAFNGAAFRARSLDAYEAWLESWVAKLPRLLLPTASIYVCGDWRSSTAIHRVLDRHFIVRNRITWEREKGRAALSNWKNASEDIWFATVSDAYFFDPEPVRIKRRVVAPYRDEEGRAKDWGVEDGEPYRLTAPSNLWTDLTVPFWSMAENTEHPTQKPEKLLAKLILASSRPGERVLDPFLGSGTTAVVSRKLDRRWIGIERDPTYCSLAERRLEIAAERPEIQGYRDGVFWDRNAGQASGGGPGAPRGHCAAHARPAQRVGRALRGEPARRPVMTTRPTRGARFSPRGAASWLAQSCAAQRSSTSRSTRVSSARVRRWSLPTRSGASRSCRTARSSVGSAACVFVEPACLALTFTARGGLRHVSNAGSRGTTSIVGSAALSLLACITTTASASEAAPKPSRRWRR
jgi:site-specific DNA-methyltransferase (adenine-specific)